MRFIVFVKATKNSEAGVMPSQELLAAMMKYNEELVQAGVMLGGEGLHPSSKGVRVKFAGSQRIVTDGPFAETNELVAGYWLWQCTSKEEAIEWVKRCPSPMPGEESEIEIRPLFEAEDFGAELTPELREREERLRAQAARKKYEGGHGGDHPDYRCPARRRGADLCRDQTEYLSPAAVNCHQCLARAGLSPHQRFPSLE